MPYYIGRTLRNLKLMSRSLSINNMMCMCCCMLTQHVEGDIMLV